MKKLRVILSFFLLVETRNFAPKVVKFSGLFLKPVPSIIKSIKAWIPVYAGFATTHALSGATTEVKSPHGNQISLNTGEDLNYIFYTGRYAAGSFLVSGLPNGLVFDSNNGSGTITGSVSQPGTYSIAIKGYRFLNQTGSSTPTYTLELNISDNSIDTDSDGDGVVDSDDSFPQNPLRASGNDFDGDGTDDEFDNDDDNDGVIDSSDQFPQNPLRASGVDTDKDGIDDEFDADNPDSNSNHIVHAFSNITAMGDGWYKSWLGMTYIPGAEGWIYHLELGWLFIEGIDQDSFWLYHGELGWLYISNSLFPFFFRHSTQGWLHYSQESDNYLLWDYSTQTKIL